MAALFGELITMERYPHAVKQKYVVTGTDCNQVKAATDVH